MGCNISSSSSGDSAKKPEQKKTNKTDIDDVERPEFQESGLVDIDGFFNKAIQPLTRVYDMTVAFHTARKAVKTLSKLQDEDFVEKCLKELKKELKTLSIEITITVDDEGVATITLTGSVDKMPSHLQKLYDAFKDLVDSIKTIITEGKELKPDIENLAEESKKLPDSVKKSAEQAGMNLLAAGKAVKVTAGNCKTLSGAPKMLQAIVTEAKATADQLKKAMN